MTWSHAITARACPVSTRLGTFQSVVSFAASPALMASAVVFLHVTRDLISAWYDTNSTFFTDIIAVCFCHISTRFLHCVGKYHCNNANINIIVFTNGLLQVEKWISSLCLYSFHFGALLSGSYSYALFCKVLWRQCICGTIHFAKFYGFNESVELFILRSDKIHWIRITFHLNSDKIHCIQSLFYLRSAKIHWFWSLFSLQSIKIHWF